MLIRGLCVFVLLCVSPLSTWASTLCCDGVAACCAGEHPDCPVDEHGTCATASAALAVATVAHTPQLATPQSSSPVEFALLLPAMGAACEDAHGRLCPPRAQRAQPLRN